jgi:DNA helicase-2/ATP-dependent DNA helicase PcrA
MLTNKAISSNLKVQNLYSIFSSITQEVNEKIDKDFSSLHLMELVELCENYKNKKYNVVLNTVKKAGFKLKIVDDKDRISELLQEIIESNINCLDALEIAFSNKLIKKSNSYDKYILYKDKILKDLNENNEYQEFKKLFLRGFNTSIKMNKE